MKKSMIAILFALSGCGTSAFTEPATNPVIEDRLGSAIYGQGEILGTLATTADRRIVVTPLIDNQEGKFCAEPSPDTAQSLAASFGANLDLSATAANSAETKVKGEFARSLLTSVGALTRRSQGLQFFRDGMFSLCQFRMNGYIDNQTFVTEVIALRSQAQSLISEEVATDNWGKLPPLVIAAPAGTKPDDAGDGDGAG